MSDNLTNRDICIISRKEITKGYKVKDDFVIETIRKIKARLGKLSNNRLYVSEEHLEEYKKKRKGYERTSLLVIGLIALLFLMGVVLPLFSGTVNLIGFASFLIIAAMMGIILLAMHVPAIEGHITYAEPRTGKNSFKDEKKPEKRKNLVPKAKNKNKKK